VGVAGDAGGGLFGGGGGSGLIGGEGVAEELEGGRHGGFYFTGVVEVE